MSDWSSDVGPSDLAGTRAMTIPRDAVGGPREASGREREAESKKFNLLAQSLKDRFQRRADLKRLARNLRFTETLEGLRIDIVDDADVSMFAIGTSQLTPSGAKLFAEVAALITEVPNRVRSEEHTSELQSL